MYTYLCVLHLLIRDGYVHIQHTRIYMKYVTGCIKQLGNHPRMNFA